MDEKQLKELREWIIDNIIQNPDIMFNDEIRTDLGKNIDVDIIEVVVWLYECIGQIKLVHGSKLKI